jgi:DNA (cytosine-5)-methyltransferase 1
VTTKTFAEFFAGIGLVGEGLRPSGWHCLYANDIDPKKHAMHAARHGVSETFHIEDVGNTDAILERLGTPPFLATASFPCVDLSLAGHYRGFEGEHSSTFFGFAQVLAALGERKPQVVMLENVVGFLTARGGQDFVAAAQHLAELGYFLDVILLDACHFVPQSRPRVFVIGVQEHLRPTAGSSLLADWNVDLPHPLRPKPILDLRLSTRLPTGWVTFDLPSPPKRTLTLKEVIDQGDDQAWWDETETTRHLGMLSERHRLGLETARGTEEPFVATAFRRMRQKMMRLEVRFDGLAGCLRTPRGGSARQIVIVADRERIRIRWMSPREYARLQGAPDFPLEGPATQMLFGFGDAVCVPAIRWIDEQVLTPLYERA